MAANYILETQRLRLRPLGLGDADFIVALLNSEGWLRYIGDRKVKTPEEAASYLRNGPLKSYAENGFGLWLVEKRDDAQPMGMCGLLRRQHLEHPDMGFAFLPQWTGKGYAFEMASATLRYARHELKLSTILAIVLPHNTSSIRLLEKTGFSFSKKIVLPTGPEELLLYST